MLRGHWDGHIPIAQARKWVTTVPTARLIGKNGRRAEARDSRRPGCAIRIDGDGHHLVGRREDRARAATVAGRAARSARSGRRRARRCHRGLPSGSIDQVRPVFDRRARAGHAARRQSPHRGVRRAGGVRADPQGHDQPRSHRERRAVAGTRLAASRPDEDACRARPAGPPSVRVRRARNDRPVAQRRGAGHDAGQALRLGRRRTARSARTGSTTCSRATRCAASRARSAPAQDMVDLLGGSGEAGRPRTPHRGPSRVRAGTDERRAGLSALARLSTC